MNNITLPEQFKIVDATATMVTTNGGVTSDIISLRDAHKVWIVAKYLQAVSHATVLTPVTGISIASCATAITFSARWWKNADVSASDTLVAQTAGTTMACTAGATNQIVVVEIDPQDIIAQLSTYVALGFTIATSGQATNFVDATFYIQERYSQATPPVAIA
jgi:hypothetical protein